MTDRTKQIQEAERFFFHGHRAALPLYEKLAACIFARIPEVTVKVQKTQITFANRHVFACASFRPARKAKDRPNPFLTVTFGLAYRLEASRVDGATEPYPNRWTHHVTIGSVDDIDEELLRWIQEAAAFSAAK